MKLTITGIFGILLIFVLLIGCSSSNEVSTATKGAAGTPAGNGATTSGGITGAAVADVEQGSGPAITVTSQSPVEVVISYDPKVKVLRDKGIGVNNYRFFFKSVYMNVNGLYVEDAGYNVLVRDLKVKKVYTDYKFWEGELFYNDVYMDSAQHSALGVCSWASIMCKPLRNQALRVNYGKEEVTLTPVGIMQNLSPEVKVKGETLVDNRQATVLESKKADGTIERLYVDNFYGLPLEQVFYKLNKDDEEVMIAERTFTPLVAGAGTVKSADVLLPENYVVGN